MYHYTSVAGLYSKDVLDILGLVKNFETAKTLIGCYVALGYEYRGEYGIERRHYFVRQTPYVSHLHIHEYGDINALNHLNFKEQLSSKPELLRELNELKIGLHEKYPDNKAEYQKEKKVFYDRVHSKRSEL
ncbi:GrpB family protein [Motilimonas sp. E26]|uniref:GrpB family protein n=1 Tax=Motilimonas sp. E26 TaxID=2865674 RepID=UPI001E540EC4|nr:GrpB family protein [Motilimonas sp. E26]MCE0556713.1 GrpB family protein [Motilimonas sp. E26]